MSTVKKEKAVREPIIRIVKRIDISLKDNLIARGASLLFAAVICIIYILALTKGELSVGKAFKMMWEGTFGIAGNEKSITIKLWDTAIFTARLLCIAVALTPAFKMKFWNIGAEGQIIMGGLMAGIFMHDFSNLPRGVIVALCIVFGLLAGAIWGIIPAVFKAKWGTNETLFTLMLNYVAMKIMDYFYNTWKGKASALPSFEETTWFPKFLGKGYTWNIIIFVALAFIMYFYLKKTKHGFEIAVIGDSSNTARYAGMNVTKIIIRTMALSGAICGLCGALTVSADLHNIACSTEAVHTVTNGYGFTAIIVAWLANFNTVGMILISLLIVFLEKGTAAIGNNYTAFSSGGGSVLIGIVLFCIIGGAFFLNYKLVFSDKIKSFFNRKNGKEIKE